MFASLQSSLQCAQIHVQNVKRTTKAATAPTRRTHVASPRPRSLPNRRQRRCTCRTAAGADDTGPSTSDALDHQADTAAIRANVEQASKLLNEVVEEVMQELFVSEAAGYLFDEQVELKQGDVIRSAIIKRIEFMDANFLGALNAYLQVAQASQDPLLLQLLFDIREEVLQQVAYRLPSAARVLDLALREAAKDKRLAVLRTALSGAQGEIPGADVASLASASGQFIDDMEEQQLVADRSLLARLVLVREELRALDQEANRGGEPSDAFRFSRANVPQRCAAFLRELVTVGDPLRRVALIDKAMSDDWQGAAPQARREEDSGDKEQPDAVRPGRFMNTLHSTVAEMQKEPGRNAAMLQRLAVVRMETLAVLDRLQRKQQQQQQPQTHQQTQLQAQQQPQQQEHKTRNGRESSSDQHQAAAEPPSPAAEAGSQDCTLQDGTPPRTAA